MRNKFSNKPFNISTLENNDIGCEVGLELSISKQSNPLSQTGKIPKSHNSFKSGFSTFQNDKMRLKASLPLSKMAFTLAEVLITLGIIGIIASISIPVLIKEMKEQQFKVGYKKAYASANEAFKMVLASGGGFNAMSSVFDAQNGCANWKTFSDQFSKTQECINNDTGKCWEMTGEHSNGAPGANSPSFVDSSGKAWASRGNCSPPTNGANVSLILVDTNGLKKPNVYGKDRWALDFKMDTIGQPIRIDPLYNKDYINGDTGIFECPTGPCYYQKWLLE